jgi:hypothetical protein
VRYNGVTTRVVTLVRPRSTLIPGVADRPSKGPVVTTDPHPGVSTGVRPTRRRTRWRPGSHPSAMAASTRETEPDTP